MIQDIAANQSELDDHRTYDYPIILKDNKFVIGYPGVFLVQDNSEIVVRNSENVRIHVTGDCQPNICIRTYWTNQSPFIAVSGDSKPYISIAGEGKSYVNVYRSKPAITTHECSQAEIRACGDSVLRMTLRDCSSPSVWMYDKSIIHVDGFSNKDMFLCDYRREKPHDHFGVEKIRSFEDEDQAFCVGNRVNVIKVQSPRIKQFQNTMCFIEAIEESRILISTVLDSLWIHPTCIERITANRIQENSLTDELSKLYNASLENYTSS